MVCFYLNFWKLAMSAVHQYRKRRKLNSGAMSSAITSLREGKMGYLMAANVFNIPKITLYHLAKDDKTPVEDLTNWTKTRIQERMDLLKREWKNFTITWIQFCPRRTIQRQEIIFHMYSILYAPKSYEDFSTSDICIYFSHKQLLRLV